MVEALKSIISHELASIGAIDAATPHVSEPGYVILLRSAKLGKQANVEQMASMLRVAGEPRVPHPSRLEPLLKLQSNLSARIATVALLHSMRLVESAIVAAYEEAMGTLPAKFERGFEKCWRRARKHLFVLEAHLENDDARVCFRCLLDRAGERSPIERGDPYPYTYICSACHDETLASFPRDIAASMPEWSDHDRDMRVIEQALGRPSKLAAELQVLNKMSGLAPELPPPPTPYKKAFNQGRHHARRQPDAIAVLDFDDASPAESDYIRLLFDYESVRERW
jgi:hypothetical protein